MALRGPARAPLQQRSHGMKSQVLACTCLSLGLAAGLSGGCAGDNHHSSTPVAEAEPQIDIATTNKEIAVGDTTTLTVTSRNTLGHNAQVQWDTTGGNLTPGDNGRLARVQFDKPGTYTVSAKLMIDGRVYD